MDINQIEASIFENEFVIELILLEPEVKYAQEKYF
ncbi:MAG: hypothetical protein K0R49_1791 [Burkholderiales bacterium]|jgi:hypothetical protein|nr:hypothetical protein [Burkholderiales bacterium]